MSNTLKWMIGSDFHIPYHNPRYMDLWFQVMDWFEPDVIDIAGDFDDSRACSRFSEGTPSEINDASYKYLPQVQEFFGACREKNPNGQIMAHTGNHEIRYDNYIDKNAPALRDIITPEILWKTDTYGIELSYYADPPVQRFGDMYVHHGLYSLKDSGDSVAKIMDEFNVSCIVGHSHRQGAVFKTYELKNEVLRGYELGHMTDIKSSGMKYTALHNWQPGFAVAHIENGVYPHVSLITISPDYTCWVDGKKFSA